MANIRLTLDPAGLSKPKKVKNKSKMIVVRRKAAHGNVHCQTIEGRGGFIAKKESKNHPVFFFLSLEYVGTNTSIVTLLHNSGV